MLSIQAALTDYTHREKERETVGWIDRQSVGGIDLQWGRKTDSGTDRETDSSLKLVCAESIFFSRASRVCCASLVQLENRIRFRFRF